MYYTVQVPIRHMSLLTKCKSTEDSTCRWSRWRSRCCFHLAKHRIVRYVVLGQKSVGLGWVSNVGSENVGSGVELEMFGLEMLD